MAIHVPSHHPLFANSDTYPLSRCMAAFEEMGRIGKISLRQLMRTNLSNLRKHAPKFTSDIQCLIPVEYCNIAVLPEGTKIYILTINMVSKLDACALSETPPKPLTPPRL